MTTSHIRRPDLAMAAASGHAAARTALAARPAPFMAAGADRRPVLAAAIEHLESTPITTLRAELADMNIHTRLIGDPHALLEILRADDQADPDSRFRLWKGAQTVLRAAGITDPGPGAPDPAATYSERTIGMIDDGARERAAAGIRCTSCYTVYGARWVHHPAGQRFLCAPCARDEDQKFRAYDPQRYAGRPACYLVAGGVPVGAVYQVRLYNGTGCGAVFRTCHTPQWAQYIAETEQPWNNTDADIWVRLPVV